MSPRPAFAFSRQCAAATHSVELPFCRGFSATIRHGRPCAWHHSITSAIRRWYSLHRGRTRSPSFRRIIPKLSSHAAAFHRHASRMDSSRSFTVAGG